MRLCLFLICLVQCKQILVHLHGWFKTFMLGMTTVIRTVCHLFVVTTQHRPTIQLQCIMCFTNTFSNIFEVKGNFIGRNCSQFKLNWDLARNMGAIYSIMDTGHRPMVSGECLRKEVGAISSRQVEEQKGQEGRFIKYISDLPADVTISQNHQLIQRRKLSLILYPCPY